MPRRHLLYRGGCFCLHELRQLPGWSGSQRLCRFFWTWNLRGVLWLSSRRKPHRVHRQRCWSLRGVCARQVQDNSVGHSSVRAMRGCSFVSFWVVSQWMRGGIRRHLPRLRRVSCGGVSCGVRASRIRAMHHVRAWVLQGQRRIGGLRKLRSRVRGGHLPKQLRCKFRGTSVHRVHC